MGSRARSGVDSLLEHLLQVGQRVRNRCPVARRTDGDAGGGEVGEFEDQVEELSLVPGECGPQYFTRAGLVYEQALDDRQHVELRTALCRPAIGGFLKGGEELVDRLLR